MKKNKKSNKFKVIEVFNPNAINIEKKMKEIFEIYFNEKLVKLINEDENKIKMIENKVEKIKKYIDSPDAVEKIKSKK